MHLISENQIPKSENYGNIPEGLAKERNYIFWRLGINPAKGGKLSKLPINPKTMKTGGQNDSECYLHLDEAIEHLKEEELKPLKDRQFHGIGLAFSDSDLVGIDLDHIYLDNGELKPHIKTILDGARGYVEKSISGTGRHVITRTNEPLFNLKNHSQGVEIFRSDSFIALTGMIDEQYNLPELPTEPANLKVLTPYFQESYRQHKLSQESFELCSQRDPNMSLEELRDIVMSIKAPNPGREFWLKVGMAIHHQTKGIEEAKDIWDDYSAQDPEIFGDYAGSRTINAEWNSFNRKLTSAVTHKTLRYMAQHYPKDVAAESYKDFIEIDYSTEAFEATEFVIDGFIPEGIFMAAGSAGVGKSTLLVPLSAAAAHICTPDYELKPSLRRRVVYLTEHEKQIRQILSGLRKHHGADISDHELKTWFKIIETKRSSATTIANLIKELVNRHTVTQKTVHGQDIDVRPLIVLDTAAATFNLSDENQNSEVSAYLGTIKAAITETQASLWIIAHLSKDAKRADIEKATPRGASAFEADIHGTGYVFDEGVENCRHMLLGKKRFTPEFNEITFQTELHSVEVVNRLGQTKKEFYRVGIASKSSKKERINSKVEANTQALKDQLLNELRCSPKGWLTRSELGKVLTMTSGPAATKLKGALDKLIADGIVTSEEITSVNRKMYQLPNACREILRAIPQGAEVFLNADSFIVTTH